MKIEIAMPPSVNSAYRAYNGRVILSKQARLWYQQAIPSILIQSSGNKFIGTVELKITLYPKDARKQDIDNRNKCLFDALTKAGVLDDDSQIKKLSIEFGTGKKGVAVVEISEIKT